jgi:Arc/MetJ-type ribon-helix-helix transcriptional regulator
MDNVTLPPELVRFGTEAVAAGRYREVSDVGVRLLQRQEQARAEFITPLEEAEAESERDGWHGLDEVMAEADRIIAAKRHGQTSAIVQPIWTIISPALMSRWDFEDFVREIPSFGPGELEILSNDFITEVRSRTAQDANRQGKSLLEFP